MREEKNRSRRWKKNKWNYKANHIRQGEKGAVCYDPKIHLPRKLRISQHSDLNVHFKADYEF